MKKLVAVLAIFGLVLGVAGCQKKNMVFDRAGRIYKIADNGQDLTGPIPTIAIAGSAFTFPDVRHDGRRIAFVYLNPSTGKEAIWSADSDGGTPFQMSPEYDAGKISCPRWYSGSADQVGYYFAGNAIPPAPTNGGVYTSRQGSPAIRINGTTDRDSRFDVNEPTGGMLQLIISDRDSQHLHRLNPISGSRTVIPPVPLAGEASVKETLPAVSIDQTILVNAAASTSRVAIRMRTINSDGSIGLPMSLMLDGFTPGANEITGLSMAGDTNAIYVSAIQGGRSCIFVISAGQYLEILRNIVNQPPSALNPLVTPKRLDTGAADSRWPSGIKE